MSDEIVLAGFAACALLVLMGIVVLIVDWLDQEDQTEIAKRKGKK